GDPERPEARASPGRLSPSSRDRPALHPGPKGGAEGAPNVPDKRGVLEGGACPPLHFSCQPPCLPAPRRMKGDRPRARRGEAMPRPGGLPGRPYERGRLPPLAMPAALRREEMKGDPECPEARASPGRLSPSSRDRPALHPGPKGGAAGAPPRPRQEGGSGRGGLPPLAFSCQRPVTGGSHRDGSRPATCRV